jgi:5-methyltetrahydropteroyltriglutamate--homocysteine methyltransferase
MQRSTDRIRTTHVGSLIRPASLAEGLHAQETQQPYDVAAFEQALTAAVVDVVSKQVDAGIDVPSDGEFGKTGWTGYGRLKGVEKVDAPARELESKEFNEFKEFYAVEFERELTVWRPQEIVEKIGPDPVRPSPTVCTGPLASEGTHAIERDIANMKAALAAVNREEGFLPLAAPASVEATIENRHYAGDEEFVYALADALRPEYQAVVESGLILQVDDAFIPSNYDTLLLQGASMEDYLKHAQVRVDALNHALRGIPEDRVRYHVCWGSWHGPHMHDVPLRDIVGLVLNVNAQAYLFEAANPRHEWEWTVWEDVDLPEGKILVPGVVTHSTHIVEHPQTIAQRIERFASVVGKENVIAGTDCGFCQGWSYPQTHESVQWAKLGALREGADVASQRLWDAMAT